MLFRLTTYSVPRLLTLARLPLVGGVVSVVTIRRRTVCCGGWLQLEGRSISHGIFILLLRGVLVDWLRTICRTILSSSPLPELRPLDVDGLIVVVVSSVILGAWLWFVEYG